VTRRAVLGGALSLSGAAAAACGPGPSAGEAPRQAIQPTTLEVWIVDWTQPTQQVYETQILPAWQRQYPQIQITMNWPTWTNMHEQLLTRFAADTQPDIFQTGASFVPEIARKRMAIVLDQLLAQWGKKADFYPAPLAQASWEGKQYGLPYLVAPRTYFYRQDVLTEIGMSRAPVTWEEQLDFARRATRHEAGRLVRAAFNTPVVDEWAMNLRVLGGKEYDENRRIIFNRPEYYPALEVLVERHSIVQPPGIEPLPPAAANAPYLVSGQYAAQYTNQSAIRNFVQNAPSELHKLVVGVPGIPGGSKYRAPAGVTPRHYARVYPDWLAISEPGKNRDAAWKFVTHLFEPEHLFAYNETLFFLPPRRSVATLSKGFLQHPQMQEMTKILDQYGGPTGLGPEFQRTSQINAQMFADAINKKRGIKEALDDAANQTMALYREIGFAK
jgi:ABC-type glycerol-3-phosphate transport system substrate-binding protein